MMPAAGSPARTGAWRMLVPAPALSERGERVRAVAGALLGMLAVVLLSRSMVSADLSPWLIAPIGASAVLVFAAPASPFAHPWAVVGGNTVAALAGIACVQAFGGAPWVAAPAVGLAIAAMLALRCLHPPGGACALLVALGGVDDPLFALHPVLLNSVLLVLAATAYNAVPWRAPARPPRPVEPSRLRSFTDGDLEAVLSRHGGQPELGLDQLHELLEQARRHARQRRSRQLRCADLLSGPPLAVQFGTPLQEAWTLLRRHRAKALPVVDRAHRLIGIVTLADFLREACLDGQANWPQRLQALIRPTPTSHSGKPETVGQIMVRDVRVVSADRPLADLLPVFASTGHHHLPVVDADRRLLGVIGESDLLRALARHD